ncbi:MAG: undecaprenyldiphospho-muramoylpentapeptide beta-N-acetylglucosaminyltransferase [Lachnospiraceae bacterium]|nr:undecaprenyldiphospho-muramoylpentapeptide beta-N-acetylglucosaminyltransferase [Lachnospiraceae bacterium]
MPKIVLTGGGTAGHVTPNIALIPTLRSMGYEIEYIGSKTGIEKRLIENQGIPYHEISSGKLRRYASVKNLSDPFRIMKGYNEAKKLLDKIKPDIVFSKGGYVSVPVVYAAAKKKIPAIIHESDITPGLANKLCFKKSEKICCNFPETLEYLPAGKAVLTGSPIRSELFSGARSAGLRLCGFDGSKPVVMVIGGSLGAVSVNNQVRQALPGLLQNFNVAHICGKGNLDPALQGTSGYVQFEYVQSDLRHLFACSDIVISRAGANAICELLALKKPALLIPLPSSGSRGDQLLNAASFEKQGFSLLLHEEDMNDETFIAAVKELYVKSDELTAAMKNAPASDAVKTITSLIDDTVFNRRSGS